MKWSSSRRRTTAAHIVNTTTTAVAFVFGASQQQAGIAAHLFFCFFTSHSSPYYGCRRTGRISHNIGLIDNRVLSEYLDQPPPPCVGKCQCALALRYLIKCEVYLCTTFDDNDVGNFSRTAHLAKLGETSEFVWPRELVCHTIG